MIDHFIHTCEERGERAAFVDKGRAFSFSQLLSHVYKMASLFKSRGLTEGCKVLLLVPPSYEFYALMFASIYYGINVVVMDSYKDISRIRRVMEENDIRFVFCNRLTGLLRFGGLGGAKFINISDYEKYPREAPSPSTDKTRTVLTTFTSGTTGSPKPIERSAEDLEKQIRTVSESVDTGECEAMYAGLPIYALFGVYSGLTCVISKKIRERELVRQGAHTVLAPIARLLALREPMPSVKRLYLGGARLYEREALRLLELFPSAHITYVYGSSECVLMAKGELRYYLENSFALDGMIEGVELSIDEKDARGVGRITARGDVVLTESRRVTGGDLGYIDGLGLHIVGRGKYSREGEYNYVTDDRLLRENPRVSRGFSFVHEGKTYFCYQGRLSQREDGIIYKKFRRLPMDPKHRTKLNYSAAIARIDGRKKKSK